MPDVLRRIGGRNVLVCDEEGPLLRGEQEALDLIGRAVFDCERDARAEWVVIPVERIEDGFFRLRTGVAGAALHRFTMYGLGVAVVGDISRHVAASSAFHDFVVESDLGIRTWFLPTLDDVEDRLATLRGRPRTQ